MSPDTLQLHYRPDLGVLTARWLTETTTTDLRAEYRAVLDAGQAYQTQRWLLDLRRRPSRSAEITNWVIHSWLPQAAAALAPARLRLAYLVSPTRTAAIRNDGALQTTVDNLLDARQPYDLRLFGDEGEAMRWLIA